jgi:hypothetical protein
MKLIKKFFRLFRIDYDKLHGSKTEGLFWLDISMIILILFNLSWIIFEFLFGYSGFRDIIYWVSPLFHDWYARDIHPYFFFYDLAFVAVFVAELIFRWIVAIHRRIHEKWWFYPFIHWYDVLGCIPLSAFRALRLLRVFSMIYRLQRLGIIDLKSTVAWKQANKYLGILTEEVSDRVVINVLSGVQDEVGKGSPIVEKVIRQVLLPRQDVIAAWMARRMGDIGLKTFRENEMVLKRVIDDSVTTSIRNNKEISRLRHIPGAGPLITDILNKSVTDITFNAIKASVTAFSDPQNNAGLINDASRFMMKSLIHEDEEEDQTLDDIVSQISVEVIELIKEEVAVRQWQLAEEERRALKINPSAG